MKIYSAILFLLTCILFSVFIFACGANNKYLVSNDWTRIFYFPPSSPSIDGLSVEILPETHLLSGEKGLFATKSFSKYDVIGEYTGIVKTWSDIHGENRYIFNLDEKNDLVIDAQDYGNELRFANSYLNISKEPNVISSNTMLDGVHRILYVCMRDIEPGEELLIDYGEDYNNEYLL